MQQDIPSTPDHGEDTTIDSGYIDLHPERKRHTPEPPKPAAIPPVENKNNDAALHVLREKLERLYAEAPDPFESVRRAAVPAGISKHQQFMHELQTSGRSLAETQTAWHNYYVALPDQEKQQVWQEFYEAQAAMPPAKAAAPPAPHPAPILHKPEPARVPPRPAPEPPEQVDSRSPSQLRNAIRYKVSAGGKLQARHHLQSLGFGLAVGLVTLVITLFSFFNEVIIAPFIQPGRASATPIIIDPSAVAAGETPEVIIPKINLEIPVDYNQTSDDENAIQSALENGVVHYPSTALPGQKGNAAYFGHSSNNIFNPGKYKFAFVLLHELVPGDTFYLTYQGKVYVYKVFKRIVVEPDDVGVLNDIPGHAATATLITCDPPGTALHRLVVVGDQISPDPGGNAGGTPAAAIAPPSALPDNGPTLWDRITSFLNL